MLNFFLLFPTPNGNTTKMDILCAEIFALSADASGLLFKALNQVIELNHKTWATVAQEAEQRL